TRSAPTDLPRRSNPASIAANCLTGAHADPCPRSRSTSSRFVGLHGGAHPKSTPASSSPFSPTKQDEIAYPPSLCVGPSIAWSPCCTRLNRNENHSLLQQCPK